MEDEFYMRYAIELAKKGWGYTNPNPLVGAVIVKENRIIAEGYHERCGELHAERNAIKNLQESAQNATIYVTLEPCCHYGRTPPCTEAIIEQGISRVVIGSRDPNPLVAGQGVKKLREHGIEVVEDCLKEECDELNPVFFHFITTKKPYVVAKYAMTLDGKIACYSGESKWITGETARNHVQTLRGRYAAIMAGIGTVISDDPMLNCRIPGAHNPLRIVVDSDLRIPSDSKLVQTAREYPLLVVCATENPEKKKTLLEAGAEVICLAKDEKQIENDSPENKNNYQDEGKTKLVPKAGKYPQDATNPEDGKYPQDATNPQNTTLQDDTRKSGTQVDLRALVEYLGERKIDSLLIEGGGTLHEEAFRQGIVNHVCAYIAPKIFGGRDAKTPVEGQGVEFPAEGVLLSKQKITALGEDLLLEYDVKEGMQGVYWNH